MASEVTVPRTPGERCHRRPGRAIAVLFRFPALSALALLALACSAIAQSRPMPPQRNQTIGETVADRPSARYRFERFVVDSPDHARRWRITLGVPRAAVPASGFPAFWMLDGNAALMEFDEALLDALAARAPQLLVFVGYDNALRVDTAARTRDYTPIPALRGEGAEVALAGGGADAFLDSIAQTILPELARRVPLDRQRQALWGHSFGGLFTLHALYRGGGVFQTYAAASPSLWWADGYMLGEPERRFFAEPAGGPARVLVMLGGGERNPGLDGRDLSDPRVAAHMRRVAAAPADAALRLSERLRQRPGLEVEYREFPALAHGPMLRASLLYALHAVTGVADRSGDAGP
ncbi:MAG: alpha/beta hydrolase-fold protein [Pseudomonas sp.]